MTLETLDSCERYEVRWKYLGNIIMESGTELFVYLERKLRSPNMRTEIWSIERRRLMSGRVVYNNYTGV